MTKLALLSLPLLAACVPTITEGPARIGQTVSVGGPTVRPLALVEDSRCPASVTCVWAGRVVVRAEVGTGAGKKEMTLTLGQPAQVADGALTLRQVTPVKGPSRPVRPGDYRFTFEFAGGR